MPKPRETHERFQIIIFSDGGSVLCSGGESDSEETALGSVNEILDQCPGSSHWALVSIKKTVVRTGSGRLPRVHQRAPEREGRGRWW